MQILIETPQLTVAVDPEGRIARFIRSEVPFASLDVYTRLHAEAVTRLDALDRGAYGLLIDVRRSMLNNDPGFEEAMARLRIGLVRGFARVAVLVQTAVGALQVARIIREQGTQAEVFHDEAVALSYLSGEGLAPSTQRQSSRPARRSSFPRA